MKLVAFESLFLCVLFCWSLFLPCFFCEAGFYLYFAAAYASDVLDDVSTCPFCSCATFLHGCVFLWIKEMYVRYLSTLFVWPQIVLAKNLPKGGLLDICLLASLFLKQTSMQDVGYDVPTCGYGSVCPGFVSCIAFLGVLFLREITEYSLKIWLTWIAAQEKCS